jgi:hypothetical protein
MDPASFDQLIRHTVKHELGEEAERFTITTQMNGPRWHVRAHRPGSAPIHDDISANPSRSDAAIFAVRLAKKIHAA